MGSRLDGQWLQMNSEQIFFSFFFSLAFIAFNVSSKKSLFCLMRYALIYEFDSVVMEI